MGKPTRTSDMEFSADEIMAFWKWYQQQDDFIKKIFDRNAGQVIRGIRNMRAGRDPLDDDGGGRKILYGAPFC